MVHKRHCVPPAFSLRDPQLEALCQEEPTGFVLVRTRQTGWRKKGMVLVKAMARIVMKFGGTSVANLERIHNVARHVKREVDAGHEVAVVVSAMSGKTNELVDLSLIHI